jgi:hypothetical protein
MSWSVDGPEAVPGLRAVCDLVAKAAHGEPGPWGQTPSSDDLASALFLYAAKVVEMADSRVRET